MESLKLGHAGSETKKTIEKMTAVFGVLELCAYLVVFSRFSSQLSFGFRGATAPGVSTRFVFLLGNAIVVVLLLGSGKFAPKTGGKEDPGDDRVSVTPPDKKKKLIRSRTEVAAAVEIRRELRKSKSENFRGDASPEEEMNGEDFRRKVEAFIERQQRVLREET
ncbi:hypothetical protein M569_10658 [Genlisea aurea]|uniref:DUF4408 domain-containing protein n=1 Tax=Genlisea aurea TaxID=192259 RepID=S8CB90_9LAMI|nr:hypothetical protein M569_10658 [Genlisea aurea]